MPSLTGFNVRFTPHWKMSVLVIFTLFLFIRLGFWQLQRADEKKQMLRAHQAHAQQTPVFWEPTHKLPSQYQQIRVQGHFISKVLLLDNQHYHHKFGFHALSPLMLANGNVVLVDRGWLVGDVTRQLLPQVDTPTGLITLQGSVYYPSTKNWRLGQLLEKEQANLVVIELVDTKLIGQFLHKSLYPFIIRLDEKEAGGFVREWAIVAMPPQRHYAYALQWFVMAFVIFIIYIALNMKKKL
jgi:surfeit locus 1 family protein